MRNGSGQNHGGASDIHQELRRRPRILIIDDDPGIVSALRAALECDAQVVTAADATEALRLLLRNGDFQHVLCDLDLGNATGADLYEAVDGADPSVARRFVFMTGRTDLFGSFLESYPNMCLRKPFGLDDLTAVPGASRRDRFADSSECEAGRSVSRSRLPATSPGRVAGKAGG